MSMGMVLEGVSAYLRQINEWKVEQCDVQPETAPPAIAGPWYVGVDEEGVEGGEENTHKLSEVFSISVGVWRRPGHLPKDRQKNLLKHANVYLPEIYTLDELERQVVTVLHGYQKPGGGPPLWDFINTKFGLPMAGKGDKFTGCLMYRGRPKTGKGILPDTEVGEFVGRVLKFRGLKRTQAISQMG